MNQTIVQNKPKNCPNEQINKQKNSSKKPKNSNEPKNNLYEPSPKSSSNEP